MPESCADATFNEMETGDTYGLFTEDHVGARHASPDVRATRGAAPARGVIEVQPTTADARTAARSEQVRRYLDQCRLVLVTTYREFVLMGPAPDANYAAVKRAGFDWPPRM